MAQAVKTAQGPYLAKALRWSRALNAAIDALPESEKKPFPGVAGALAAAHAAADVAVVSSANREAVVEEWQRRGPPLRRQPGRAGISAPNGRGSRFSKIHF